MNVIEIIGACIGLCYLYFEYKASIWTWIFGVLMPVAYVYIFFRSGLYANTAINVYYIAASVYGYVVWRRNRSGGGDEAPIASCPRRYVAPIVLVVLALTGLLTWVLSMLNESLYPFLDGLTASLSVAGMWMLAKKYYQEWLCWIVVEPLMVVLGILTGMYATAAMYLVYGVVAVMGYFRWKKLYKKGLTK